MVITQTLVQRPVANKINQEDVPVTTTTTTNTNTSKHHQLTSQAERSSKQSNRRSDGKDFNWSYTDEPHATRRKLILTKYPQIKELFGPEPLTLPIVMLILAIQFTVAWFMRDFSWPVLFTVAYIVGGTLNHSLQLAVHELSHNLAFHNQTLNKLLGIMGNLPTGVPSAITFQKYHMDHHQFQGVDGIDTDVPTMFEVNFFTNTLLKLFWVCCQPLFYALRPVLVKPKPMGKWELINLVLVLSSDAAVLYLMGLKSFVYLISGTLMGLGLHPSAGHFIAEHYEYIKGQETYSYYGFWNFFNWNVGYHNEHHDFPKVAWSRLPMVKKIAPEFYDTLPHYNSYCYVIWKYITDPEIGPFSRVKRIQPLKANSDETEVMSDINTANTKAKNRTFAYICVSGLLGFVALIFYSAIMH